MTRLLLLTLLALALLGCEQHGKYTQAFLDEAEKDRRRMRAAMKYDTAVQQFESGDLELALETINATIEMDPDNAEIQYHLGTALLGLGRMDEAVARLEKYVEMAPADAPNRGPAQGMIDALKQQQ